MTLVPIAALDAPIGAFNVITLEHAEAIVAGAEAARRPVVLQISENAIRFHAGRPGPLAAACTVLALRFIFARAHPARASARSSGVQLLFIHAAGADPSIAWPTS